MGNEIEKCCRHCINFEGDEFSLETRYLEIEGNFQKPLRCRKFYISSEPLQKQKINELLIFTDSSLTMTIPNFNLKLKDDELEKLEETVKYEIYNNNLIIKENCFVLNAIEEEMDSEYDEFKEFPSKSSLFEENAPLENSLVQNETEIREKLRNEIEEFTLRNKSRAFRFKSPLKNYDIGQIIVAIVPVFEKPSDLNLLKEAVEQGLSMSEDMKSVGVSEISFMLGYEQSVFQKMILEYILGYSKTKKEYVFKRMSNFVYLTRSNEQISNFFKFLTIYTKNKLEKNESLETLGSEKEKNNIRKLGANYMKKPEIIANNLKKAEVIGNEQKYPVLLEDRNKNEINNNKNGSVINNSSLLNQNVRLNSSGNTSFHSYSEGGNLIGIDRERIVNNSQSNINLSRRSFFNHDLGLNVNDISEIKSSNSETSDIKNIKIRSFKSKESNVSDYF